MKSTYDEIPDMIVKYSMSEVMINYNVYDSVDSETGKRSWYCDSVVVGKEILEGSDYGALVDALLREHYTLSQELSILRQKDTKPEDWEKYNNVAEECKKLAKTIWNKK